MLAKSRIAQFLAYAVGVFVIWAIAGCGGDGGGDGIGGKVALKIAWPKADTRYIPSYAHSLAFTLYAVDTEQEPITLVVNRPEELPLVQTVTFEGPIIGGNYLLKGLAQTGLDGGGFTVATATTDVEVASVGTTTVALTLASTLKSIELLNMPLTINEGESVILQVKVLDNDDVQVFLPNGVLSWSMVFGSTLASVDADGILTANDAGSARVRVSEIGAGLYSDGDITINPLSFPTSISRAKAKATPK